VKKTIQDRLRDLRGKVRSGNLSQGGGLGNEVNYHIFDYDPSDETAVNHEIENIARSLGNIKVFNIYDIIIDILKEKNYLDKSYELEQKKGSDFINKAIMRTLKTDSKKGLIVEKIVTSIKKGDIIFLTGIGNSYQIIRAHTLLSNLQSVINDTENPVILFYPGSYDHQALSLFNTYPAENYYRAFKLVDR
jgi:hypothetical protein